jgi:hypothetical protein
VPQLRRPPRHDVVTYKVRVPLDHSTPPIWRRLELRSDLTLDVVHEILQAAYGWHDSHLHRFALGGSPFDLHSEVFLCPYDVEEGEEDGAPAADVRLDETLQQPGDTLHYVYDYGDSWEVTLELEAVRPHDPGAPDAVCTGGRRAAPPEDSGGSGDVADLAQLLDDPAHFDTAEVNGALEAALVGSGLHPRLAKLVQILERTATGADLAQRVRGLADLEAPTQGELRESLKAYLWFLDRAADGGIPLTAQGYLKPADVQAAADVIPSAMDWPGTKNRETHTYPVMFFRESMQAMGLIRKYKGALVLGRPGKAAHGDLDRLVDVVADSLLARCDHPAQLDAALLVLAYAATSPGRAAPFDRIPQHLTDLGWRTADTGSPVRSEDVWAAGPQDVLCDIGTTATGRRDAYVSPVAAYVARRALQAPR